MRKRNFLSKEEIFNLIRSGFLFEAEEVEKLDFEILQWRDASMIIEINSKKFKVEITEEE